MIIFLAEIKDGKAYLNESETTHCTKVLRKDLGDSIRMMDGKGSFYEGKIISFNKKETVVSIEMQEQIERRRPYNLHLAISPTKQIDRIEWLIEKAVEIGVDEITLLRTKNTERTKVNLERLNSICLSAAKQSLKAFLPIINDIVPFEEFVKEVKCDVKAISYCGNINKKSIKSIINKNLTTGYTVLVGP
ncbi:MAG: 16S rRNA (uracil(1498)-N(3))-methyltransferase, partial [Bacteroidia bacterium]